MRKVESSLPDLLLRLQLRRIAVLQAETGFGLRQAPKCPDGNHPLQERKEEQKGLQGEGQGQEEFQEASPCSREAAQEDDPQADEIRSCCSRLDQGIWQRSLPTSYCALGSRRDGKLASLGRMCLGVEQDSGSGRERTDRFQRPRVGSHHRRSRTRWHTSG
jgi:hypothetical protein